MRTVHTAQLARKPQVIGTIYLFISMLFAHYSIKYYFGFGFFDTIIDIYLDNIDFNEYGVIGQSKLDDICATIRIFLALCLPSLSLFLYFSKFRYSMWISVIIQIPFITYLFAITFLTSVFIIRSIVDYTTFQTIPSSDLALGSAVFLGAIWFTVPSLLAVLRRRIQVN